MSSEGFAQTVMHAATARFASLVAAAVLAGAPATLAADANAIHQRILTLDSHLDTPMSFGRPGWSIMDNHTYADDLTQVDYPRMVRGGLDGGVFAIYTGQGPRTPEGYAAARDQALKRAVEIHEMVARNTGYFALATKAEDAARIVAARRRVVYMSMENAYPVGKDLTLLKTFYDLGVRMIGPVHFSNNDLADSATDPKGPEWHGLSPLGRELVAEANRLGVVIDASHASDLAFDQMLALSTTPIILSHSGAKAVFNHPRNIDDARIKALAAKGGVIQINSYSDYMVRVPETPELDAEIRALNQRYGPYRTLAGDTFRSYVRERRAIEARHPVPRATMNDLMEHILHTLKLVGPDHVGIGLDLDGGGGVTGLDDVEDIPEITRRLLAAGYSEADLAKIWSGNVLRLLREAEAKAAR
jgi:membrane dipeptidase